MKIEKIKVYIIGTERGWIDVDLDETENLINLREFETFEKAQECSNELNKFNKDYSIAGEINKVYVNNDFKGYFETDWSDKEIQEVLENRE